MTVNEAFARLDLLAQATVEAIAIEAPPAAPTPGQAWIVGPAPTGAWAGEAGALAGWTEGGWRFLAPPGGMTVWSAADGCWATYVSGAWRVGRLTAHALEIGGVQVVGARQPAIAAPIGGDVIDAESRAGLAAVLQALRSHGIIAP